MVCLKKRTSNKKTKTNMIFSNWLRFWSDHIKLYRLWSKIINWTNNAVAFLDILIFHCLFYGIIVAFKTDFVYHWVFLNFLIRHCSKISESIRIVRLCLLCTMNQSIYYKAINPFQPNQLKNIFDYFIKIVSICEWYWHLIYGSD